MSWSSPLPHHPVPSVECLSQGCQDPNARSLAGSAVDCNASLHQPHHLGKPPSSLCVSGWWAGEWHLGLSTPSPCSQKGLCRCEQDEDLGVERLFLIFLGMGAYVQSWLPLYEEPREVWSGGGDMKMEAETGAKPGKREEAAAKKWGRLTEAGKPQDGSSSVSQQEPVLPPLHSAL